MTFDKYSLEELLQCDEELRLVCLNCDDTVWGLCINIACDNKAKEGCAYFSSESYDSVWVTLYKNLVCGTLIKEIPLNTPGKHHDDVYIAISSFQHMLMKYSDYTTSDITKLSIYANKYEDDYDGCAIPQNELYILIE